jgi:hypothetical protein
MKKRRHN